MNDVTIIDYQPAYQPDFKRLNVAWIARYFQVEPHDLEQLDDPEHHVLSEGGHILLAETEGVIVGTVAMIKVENDRYELAKMAVDDAYQGRQIGKKLGEAALDWARRRGAREVFLESNRRLSPALSLYQRLGFQEVAMIETPYARADIRMSILL